MEDFVIAAVNALERLTQLAVDASTESFVAAEQILLRLIKRRGWRIEREDGSLPYASKALAVVLGSFMPEDERALDVYAEAAELVAQHEIPNDWAPEANPDAALRYAVLGTVLFEPLILALRRMANVARSRKVLKKPRVSTKSSVPKRVRE
ncbi:MAG: hypothetical protein RLZZ450_7069 [Pseudomonadota bacterium]|jgi:hypothetical protein